MSGPKVLLLDAAPDTTGDALAVPEHSRKFFTIQVNLTGAMAGFTLYGSIGGLAGAALTPIGAESAEITVSGIYTYYSVPGSIYGVSTNQASTAVTAYADFTD